ncbi:hypothetical protein [Sulfurimonas sp.]|uniref:hypothetical protein n=1 Tax=Sulfurimonas sp. TaxID=2022749 RepID=UPI00286E2252|nr:hypothetical protein [Sulfurimonas sp.]
MSNNQISIKHNKHRVHPCPNDKKLSLLTQLIAQNSVLKTVVAVTNNIELIKEAITADNVTILDDEELANLPELKCELLISYDLPSDAVTYMSRLAKTTDSAIVLLDISEQKHLYPIETLLRRVIKQEIVVGFEYEEQEKMRIAPKPAPKREYAFNADSSDKPKYDKKPFEKPKYDRPKREGESSERKPFEKPKYDKKPFEKSSYDRPKRDGESSERKPFEKPKYDKKPFEKPKYDRPKRDGEGSERKPFEKPKYDKKPFEKSSYDRPKRDGESSERKPFEKPKYDKKPFEKSSYDRPKKDGESSERKPFEKPKYDKKPNKFLGKDENGKAKFSGKSGERNHRHDGTKKEAYEAPKNVGRKIPIKARKPKEDSKPSS